MMGTEGLERFKQDRDALQLAVQGLEQSQSPERQLTAALAGAILESYDRIIMCAEEGRPFIANTYANAPELFVALDVPELNERIAARARRHRGAVMICCSHTHSGPISHADEKSNTKDLCLIDGPGDKIVTVVGEAMAAFEPAHIFTCQTPSA